MRPASIRLNVRVFSVFLIVGLVMLAGASYFVIGVGQAGLRTAWGEHLRQVADRTAAAVDTYVFRLVIDASVLSKVPQLRESAAAASAKPFERAAASAIDRDWQRSAAVKEVAADKASAFLAEVTQQNPIYRQLLLTDRQGRLVAASGSAPGYLFTSANWWTEAVGDGVHGRLFVSDVAFDQRAGVWSVEIAAPVEDPAGGQLAGVLYTTVDFREIGSVLNGVRMGVTGDAALVREDGSFVFARRAIDPNAKFFATDLLRERLNIAKKGEPQTPLFFNASTADGNPRLVGIGMSQLKASFPRMAWFVAVSQGEEELFAPVKAASISLLVVFGLMAVAVILFALWYSTRIEAPSEPEEMDLHLVKHPRVHRIAEPETVDEEEAEAEAEAEKEKEKTVEVV